MTKVLAILPYEPDDVRIRTLSNLGDLNETSDVTIVCCSTGQSKSRKALDRAYGNRFTWVEPVNPVWKIFMLMVAVIRMRPLSYYFYFNPRLQAVVEEKIRERHYDVLFIERLPLEITPKKYAGKIIYDCVDCFTFQTRMLAKRYSGLRTLGYIYDSLVCKKFEVQNCNRADLVIVTAEREMVALQLLGVSSKISVYRHGLKVKEPKNKGAFTKRGKSIYSFHGKLTYPPNELALGELNQIFEGISANVEMVVIGDCSSTDVKRYPKIKFQGFVDDLAEALAASDYGVFPIEVSVGIPNKVVEAMAAGLPVVITQELAKGIDGIEELIGRGVFVENIDGFATRIEKLSQLDDEERSRMGRRCSEFIRRINDQNIRRKRLRGLLVQP